MSSSVMDAFKSLNVATAQDLSDHEAIFEVSYQYLSKVKGFKDLSAFHNCIVSLINSDKYHRAYQLIKEVPSETHDQFVLEKAYVYYKLGHVAEVEAVYSSAANASEVTKRALKHVLAQSYYQDGRISESLSLYRDLMSSNSIDNELDLACNERAILSQMGGASHEPLAKVAESDKTYDIIFNEALIKLRQNDVSSGLNLLERAAQMCLDQSMDSDPADLAMELAPIKLSIAYAHQVTGNTAKALQVLQEIDISSNSDLMISLLVKNNMASLIPQEDNLNFLSRELNLQHNLQLLKQKLTKAQHSLLLKNHLSLSYQTNTLSKSSSYFSNRFTSQFINENSGDATPLIYKVLVKLGISIQNLNSPSESKIAARKVYKFVMAQIENDPKNMPSDYTVAAVLLLAHLNSKAGTFDQSESVLKKVTDLEKDSEYLEELHPCVFGLFTNYLNIDRSKAESFYYDFLLKLTQQSKDLSKVYDLARWMALKGLVSDFNDVNFDPKGPNILDRFSSCKPDDVIVSGVLKGDTSAFDPVEDFFSNLDADELMEVDFATLCPVREIDHTRKKPYKVKKAKKPRFSKNKVLKAEKDFEPEKLDQERWMPMKLRSYYKPPKKTKKKPTATQGTTEKSQAPSVKKQQKKKKGKK